MNKDKLKNIIELIVRKEIKKQLSEIFINDKKEISFPVTIKCCSILHLMLHF